MRRKRGVPDRSGRSAARMAAVQGLYQMDLAATDLNVVIEQLANRAVREAQDEEITETGDGESDAEKQGGAGAALPDATFMAEILRGVVRLQRDIDPAIDAQLATGWRLARVDSILRATLRAGVYELMERQDVPARVVINEYLDIAHAFLPQDEARVVNGVLDKLARRLRPAEFVTSS